MNLPVNILMKIDQVLTARKFYTVVLPTNSLPLDANCTGVRERGMLSMQELPNRP